MPFDLEGPTRIRNIKFDVFIGRPPIEDSSLLPKSFIPLQSKQVGKNAIFHYNTGYNSKQWEFHSTKAIVGKTDDVSGLRPAALLGSDDEGYHWEADNPARTMCVLLLCTLSKSLSQH